MAGKQGTRRRGALILLLAIFSATPAAAAPASQEPPGGQVQADADAAVEMQLTAFANWLNRANAIQMRSQGLLMGLGPTLRQINASDASASERDGSMRALLQQALTATESVGVEFEALDTPAFPEIDLPEELRPVALKRQMLELNRSYRSLIADLLRAVDVGMSNPAAFATAVQGLFRNVAAIYDSQILLARATMESAPQDSSERAIHALEVASLRGMYRLFRAYSPFDPAVDEGLPADLDALAREVDAQVRNGETRLAAELAEMEGELAAENAESSRAALLRRAIATISIGRDYLPPARRLAAHFRALAQSLRGQVLTEAALARVFPPFRQFRTDMDAVAMRQNQAMATAP